MFEAHGTDATGREFARRGEVQKIQTVTPVLRVTSVANATGDHTAAFTFRIQLLEIRVLAL